MISIYKIGAIPKYSNTRSIRSINNGKKIRRLSNQIKKINRETAYIKKYNKLPPTTPNYYSRKLKIIS